jgi:hypothetical protein
VIVPEAGPSRVEKRDSKGKGKAKAKEVEVGRTKKVEDERLIRRQIISQEVTKKRVEMEMLGREIDALEAMLEEGE